MEFAARTEAPGRKFVRDENNGIVETSNGGGIYTFPHANSLIRVSQRSVCSTCEVAACEDYNIRTLSPAVSVYHALIPFNRYTSHIIRSSLI